MAQAMLLSPAAHASAAVARPRIDLGVALVSGLVHPPVVVEKASEQVATISDLWTAGPLACAVQLAALFTDSKTFVDMPTLVAPHDIQANFARLHDSSGGNIPALDLQVFINQHFGLAGSDFEQYSPLDYQVEPVGFLPLVTDPAIRQWALDVHALWPYLSRADNGKMGNPSQRSLIMLPNPGVVAGDRFREVYYWDSFWILQGLLVSGMTDTAKNVVSNLVALASEYGFIPNGARTYYLNRSQPPLLSQMVRIVWEATNDTRVIEQALNALKMEYKYWTTFPKAVPTKLSNGKTFAFSRFYANWDRPRPESYMEDVKTAEGLPPSAAAELWRSIASAAESGWDFSARWFADGESMRTIRTSVIFPSDLNAFLYQMENNIALFCEQLGQADCAASYRQAACARQEAMQDVMWDANEGRWTDVYITDLDNGNAVVERTTDEYYVSNYIPLWAGVLDDSPAEAQRAVHSFLQSGLLQSAGVVTSLNNSGQQWDAPNAWAPLQSIMVDALDKHGGEVGQEAARKLVQAWLASNYAGWEATGKMVEKYDASQPGVSGGGGEYEIQTGFGWTNGVMLDFLHRFGWNPELAQAPATSDA